MSPDPFSHVTPFPTRCVNTINPPPVHPQGGGQWIPPSRERPVVWGEPSTRANSGRQRTFLRKAATFTQPPAALTPLRWRFGSEEFGARLLERLEGKLGENQTWCEWREGMEERAQRIVVD